MANVLFVIPSLGNGGAERVVVDLANNLVRHGMQVGIAILSKKHNDYLDELKPTVEVSFLGKNKNILGKKLAFRRLMMIAKEYDNIVSALETFTDDWVYLCKKRFDNRHIKKKIFTMVHISLSNYHRFENSKRRKLLSTIYPQCDGIIAVSEGVKTDLVNIFGETVSGLIKVIYDPLELSRIKLLAESPVETNPWKPYFINVGRLERQKDHETLLKSFRKFSDRVPVKHHLLICGRGQQEEEIRQLIKQLNLDDVVHLLGFNKNPWAYMREATALVSTSIFEGFSLVIAEAMAVGTPVIATDCPSGPAELLQDGLNGILVAPRDVAGIAAAMLDVASSPETAKARTCRAGAYATRFDAAAVAREYAVLFGHVTGND